MAERVARIERVLSTGSTFPSIVTAVSGRQYVLKLGGAGPGTRSLATEYLALKLARRVGLSVPDAELIEVPGDFPWQAGTDEFYETVKRSAGWNLGVALIPDARDVPSAELAALPPGFLRQLAGVDALLQNYDRRAVNANIMRDAAGRLWAIEFGACLLIERLARGARELRTELPANHFLANRRDLEWSVREVAEGIGPAIIRASVAELPAEWLIDIGLSKIALAERLAAYAEDACFA
jgi:hypothetical protein